MDRRVALGLFVGSVAVTVVCFLAGFPFFFLLLFLPLLFVGKREVVRCPVCGVVVERGANYCSVCGARIEREKEE